jgi:AraC-like DNA-binding protein
LDPRRKLAFWNDRASESFSPLVSEPEDIRAFNGSIVRGSIGDMTLAEACSRALQSGAQRGRTVTAIAFDYGFNSPTHFGRVFRAKFNVTPREYRREKAGIS